MSAHQLPKMPASQPEDWCSSGKLVPIDIAYEKGLSLTKPVNEVETVDILNVAGRICSKTIKSPLALPPFDNSAMDGYAVRTSELRGDPPYTLPVHARIAAGDDGSLPRDGDRTSAVRILTGAPVPPGYDAVIMQEQCIRNADGIVLARRPGPGENIRRKGEDCASGTTTVAAGARLDARHVALLAALGLPDVQVGRRVRVACFSTGTELRQPGQTLEHGQIYNSNRFMLMAMLNEPHIELIDLGAVPDDPERLDKALRTAASRADLIMTTGGVSVGDEDHMPRLLQDAGGEIHVMKVGIKPGKPLTVGTLGGAVYVGLPGNPVAAFVNCMLMVKPMIDRLAGGEPRKPEGRPAIAAFERTRRPGRQEYLPARILHVESNGTPVIEGFKKAGSATLVPLAEAHGLAVIPAECAAVSHGDLLKFIPFG